MKVTFERGCMVVGLLLLAGILTLDHSVQAETPAQKRARLNAERDARKTEAAAKKKKAAADAEYERTRPEREAAEKKAAADKKARDAELAESHRINAAVYESKIKGFAERLKKNPKLTKDFGIEAELLDIYLTRQYGPDVKVVSYLPVVSTRGAILGSWRESLFNEAEGFFIRRGSLFRQLGELMQRKKSDEITQKIADIQAEMESLEKLAQRNYDTCDEKGNDGMAGRAEILVGQKNIKRTIHFATHCNGDLRIIPDGRTTDKIDEKLEAAAKGWEKIP